MSALRDEARDLFRGQLRHVGQVGARREDVLLAGDRDGVDLAGVGALLERLERLPELGEGRRSQRVGAGVVATVVEGDQRKHVARGQTHVADGGVGHHLVAGEGVEGREVDRGVVAHVRFFFPSKNGFSQMTEPPWPRPTHMAVRP